MLLPKFSFALLAFVTILVSTSLESLTHKAIAQVTDLTPPYTSYIQTPGAPDGDNDWYVSPVSFDLYATDLESGVNTINYRIDGGAWQTVTFAETANLALNPSFETAGGTTSGLAQWEATLVNPEATYSQDAVVYAPGYATHSAKVVATGGAWHGINNSLNYALATPYDNMTASVWLRSQDITGTAYFNVYAVSLDALGIPVYTLIATSPTITGTTNWQKISLNFSVNVAGAQGVYVDVGLSGPGTLWADAVTINSALNSTQTNVTIGTDSEDHSIEFYSTDFAGNAELHSCITPLANCVTFKIDQTNPTNWRNSGAYRGIFGTNYQLWVHTDVDDVTSGLKVFSDKYQYYTELQPGFGRFSNLLSCSSTWQPDIWTLLITPPFDPGAHTAYLLTPKTSFCNSNWKLCKIVNFYVEDMAGNSATKDFCINGPWIEVKGEGVVRSNNSIDMLSEANGDNTDGLIEAGGPDIDFFTSSKGWQVKFLPPVTIYDYTALWNMTVEKTEITDGSLGSDSGVFNISSSYAFSTANLPAGYQTEDFNKIVFVDGDLTIEENIDLSDSATLLFIVSGNAYIDKTVTSLETAIFVDGQIETAYNISEAEATETLNLYGIYWADSFTFQRTLQGTTNNDIPSERFNYEPKYLINLRDFLNTTNIQWK